MDITGENLGWDVPGNKTITLMSGYSYISEDPNDEWSGRGVGIMGMIVIGSGTRNVTFTCHGSGTYTEGLPDPRLLLYDTGQQVIGFTSGNGTSFTYPLSGGGTVGHSYTVVLSGGSLSDKGFGSIVAEISAQGGADVVQASYRGLVGYGSEILSTKFAYTGYQSTITCLGKGPTITDYFGDSLKTIEDPAIGLYDTRDILIDYNNDWATNKTALSGSNINWTAGLSAVEAILWNTLTPGSYYCTMQPNKGLPGGIGLVEVYLYTEPQ